ncbi:MAG: exopolysaccharide biosynthesis polyprenyl glycosylphosphotransferase [Janthinobacterium lividum]
MRQTVSSTKHLLQAAKLEQGQDTVLPPFASQVKAEPIDVYGYSHPVLPWTIKIIDVVATIAATLLLTWGGGHLLTHLQDRVRVTADLVSILIIFLWPKTERLLDIPHVTRIWDQARYIGSALLVAAISQFIILWVLGWAPAPSATTALNWFVAAGLTLLLVRSCLIYVLSKPSVRSRLACRLAIVGDGIQASGVAERFSRGTSGTFSTLGIFSDTLSESDPAKVRGSLTELVALSRERTLHGVIIAVSPSQDNERQIEEIVWQLRSVSAHIYVMPHLVPELDVALPIEVVGPVSLMVLRRRPLTERQTIAKLGIDLLFGSIALIILLPLLLTIALAIKLDSPGPVFFRQSRLGFNNRSFQVFKFRSMYADMADPTAMKQTSRNDARVTRVGKWLRKLSLDELPQLLNVLRNEMSLVGPRPHAPHTRAGGELLDDALAEYVIRHQVKPGITGWAQVNGSRGELVTTEDLHKRVTLDLEYMQRWSIWFDIKIMFLTVIREVVSRHSY